MSNRIAELLEQLKKDKGMTVPEFAKKCDLAPTTIYSARSKPTMEHIHVDVFLKIAKGLGMTAEELYYGEKLERPHHQYADPRQREINDAYDSVNEDGKQAMWTNAVMARTTFPDGIERGSAKEVAE